jgi:hypothetical protein
MARGAGLAQDPVQLEYSIEWLTAFEDIELPAPRPRIEAHPLIAVLGTGVAKHNG